MTRKLLTDEDAIYAAVGRAMTTWAEVEDSLGQVYCASLNPRNFLTAERAYWAIASFEGRLKMTTLTLEQRSKGLPSLSNWPDLLADLTTQNKVRNKIAHGAVINGSKWKGLLNPPKWVLAPFYHSRKRPHEMEQIRKMGIKSVPLDEIKPLDTRPKERLTLKQLVSIRGDFEKLRGRLDAFCLAVERLACIQEGVPLATDPKDQRLLTILSGLPPKGTLPRARS